MTPDQAHDPSDACYKRGCRLPGCAAAHRDYGNERSRLIAYGRWEPFTDAEPVRQHVKELAAAGLTYTAIETLAGVSEALVFRLMNGAADRRPSTRIRRDAAERILAVSPRMVPSPDTRVDGTGTRRRLQALCARGWCPAAIGAEMGRDGSSVKHTMTTRLVRDSTRREVAAVYGRLWDKPPPSATKRARTDAAKAMRLAGANGWPPPMAWDDEDLDNPDASPAKGWKRSDVTPPPPAPERVREALSLFGDGEIHETVARRMGMDPGYLDRFLHRSGVPVADRSRKAS